MFEVNNWLFGNLFQKLFFLFDVLGVLVDFFFLVVVSKGVCIKIYNNIKWFFNCLQVK